MEYLMVNQETRDYSSAAEYADALRHWMWEWHTLRFYTLFPFGLPPPPPSSPTQTTTAEVYEQVRDERGNVLRQRHQVFPNGIPAALQQRLQQLGIGGRPRHTQIQTGHIYRIPSIFKRLGAETVDFLILFVLKMFLTFVAAEEFDIIQLSDYDWSNLTGEDNFETALQLTQELLILELIYRLSCLIYETMFIHRGLTSPGGATPGKRLLGLKVVYCSEIRELPNGTVLVVPANDLGFGWALMRSLVKNFSIAFVFPVTLTMCLFQHNRAVYDLVANSIVVEDVNS